MVGTKTISTLLLGTCVWLVAAPAWAGGSESRSPLDPIPLRAISPLRLLFFQLTPESARPLGRGNSNVRIDISESNVLHIRNVPPSEFDAEINLEITRVNLRLRLGATANTDLGLELPIYRFHTGFLDGHIRNVEDFVGDLKVQRVFEREIPGAGLFRYRLKSNGEIFFEPPGPRSGIGDVALTVKHQMQSQGPKRPALSLRGAIKFPTGDEDLAMGSGDIDVAVGIGAEYQWKRWASHASLNGTVPFGDPFQAVGLLSPPMLSGHLGGAFRPNGHWAFHFQLGLTSEPFKRTKNRAPSSFSPEPFENFGGSIVDGTLGASRQLSRKAYLTLALAEDFHNTTNAAADVSLLMSVSLRGLHGTFPGFR